MKRKRLSTVLNLSSQANLHSSDRINLSQFNYLVMLGLEFLNKSKKQADEIPITISIDKSGQLEIAGLDEETLNNKNKVRVYTEKKVTYDKESANVEQTTGQ